MRRASWLLTFSLAVGLAHADVPFLTENWSNLNNWTVQAGTPAVTSALHNSSGNLYTPTRLLYVGTPPTPDHSIDTMARGCTSTGANARTWSQYLRVSGSNWYEVRFSVPAYQDGSWLYVYIYKTVSGSPTMLGYTQVACVIDHYKSVIIGGTITASIAGTSVLSVSDSSFTSGNVGVGTSNFSYPSEYMWSTVLAYSDTTPPSAPTGLTAAALYHDHVNLSWVAADDNSDLPGPPVVHVSTYKIYRGGVYIGSSSTTQFTDPATDYLTQYTYTVKAVDPSGNESGLSSPLTVTTLPPQLTAPETGSPVEYASSWGAGPERISLLTGAFSFRLPLAQPKHRGPGPGAGLTASWTSQIWNWDSTGSHMTAIDVGYGLGVVFQIGGIWPIFGCPAEDPSCEPQELQLQRYDFQDAAGVIHKLLPAGGTKYRSQDSTYLLWDDADRTLRFTDGTVWNFDCISRWGEPDSGTRYPTKLTDSNGNVIVVTYMPAVGMSESQTNNSGRIKQIKDSQTQYNWNYSTYNGKPHVSTVTHNQPGNGTLHTDAYYTYTTATLTSPFDSTTVPSVTLLASVTFTGLPNPYKFTYSTAGTGEMTKVQFPYSGYFRYEYEDASFSGGARKIREVSARYMCAAPSGTPIGNTCETGAEQAYTFDHPDDSALPAHTRTTVADPSGNQKVWDFISGSLPGWANGLESVMRTYAGTTTVMRTVNTDWTQDDTTSDKIKNPRAWKVVTTLEDGTTKSMTQRDVDSNGNTTQVREYGFYTGSDPSTPYRTTSTTYLGGTNYTDRNILNRPTAVTVCSQGAGCGTPASQASYSYDSYGSGMSACTVAESATRDSNYPNTFTYRGNVTQTTNNGVVVNASQVDICGNVLQTKDGSGNVLGTTTMNTFSQVSNVTGGGNSSSFTYQTTGQVNSATGSNSDTVNFSYSSYRPTSITNPDGSTSTLSYNDTYPASRAGTTPQGRVSKTVYDGFGRPTKSAVRKSTGPEVWIVNETVYNACSCSTTGKAKQSSRPYLANSSLTATETVYWTTSTFDALGRPTQVALPDGNSTSYAYGVDSTVLATTTLVTEPGGKQKKYFNNAFGQLIRVHEPLVSSTLVESARYTYNVLGRMTNVQMGGTPQGTSPTSFSQTRTFNYNSQGQLTSAVNPENGTVSYTYRSDGLLATKTDAKSQTLTYVYDDATKKLTAVKNGTTTLTSFRYGIASDPSAWKAVGRLVSATQYDGSGYNPYSWWYAYDSMGRVSKQTLVTPSNAAHQAQYGFDTDSRMNQIKYPGTPGTWNGSSQPTDNFNTDGVLYTYAFNTLGQQTSMQQYTTANGWQTLAHGATYNAAGQITLWNEGSDDSQVGWNEMTRSYDAARGWVNTIRQRFVSDPTCCPQSLNLAYSYNPNGRVSAVTDTMNPAFNTTYQYDNLNRLTQATARQNAQTPIQWQLGWTYDEFGNRLTQSPLAGTPYTPTTNRMSYGAGSNRITGYSFEATGDLLTTNLAYDNNGNLTTIPLPGTPSSMTIQYDLFDRVTQAVKGGVTSQYAYDAFGKRVAVTVSGSTTVHFFDISGRLLTNSNVYFAGQRVGQWTDRLGSVRKGSGGDSNYYPYGEEIASTGNNRYKFAETFRDSDTGLDYAMARFYSASTARFLSVDGGPSIATIPGTWNRYAYAADDPVNLNDPGGKVPRCVDRGALLAGGDASSPCGVGQIEVDVPIFGSVGTGYAIDQSSAADNLGYWLVSQGIIDSYVGGDSFQIGLSAAVLNELAYQGLVDAGTISIGGRILITVIVTAAGKAGLVVGGAALTYYVAKTLADLFIRARADAAKAKADQEACEKLGWPGDDPTKAPGSGWEWHGPDGDPVGTGKGAWHNPGTGESLRPGFTDPNHPKHWDYQGPNDTKWWIWEDGRCERKPK